MIIFYIFWNNQILTHKNNIILTPSSSLMKSGHLMLTLLLTRFLGWNIYFNYFLLVHDFIIIICFNYTHYIKLSQNLTLLFHHDCPWTKNMVNNPFNRGYGLSTSNSYFHSNYFLLLLCFILVFFIIFSHSHPKDKKIEGEGETMRK